MLQVLDAAALRRWCEAGRQALSAARAEIDALNVYPVPDGDTGTNLLLTMQAVEQAVREAGPDLDATTAAMARGALLGARGNSGVILSQLLRGLAEVLARPGGPGGEQLARALMRASDLGAASVATPVEGTVLSVARAAADGAVRAAGADLAGVARAARRSAEQCLARTPDMLPALREAGVVDAGGRGLCVLLQALEAVVTGNPPAPPVRLPPVPPLPDVFEQVPGAGVAARESGSDAYGYEVQYLLRDSSEQAVSRLRQVLGGLGDSLAVAGADGVFNVHVHVNDVGAALAAGEQAGRPSRVTVTRFADQVARHQVAWHRVARQGPGRRSAGGPAPARAVVAVAAGEGLLGLLSRAGATVVDASHAPPSAADLLAAVRATGAREVVLLPDDAPAAACAKAAAQAAAGDGLHVVVLPTRSAVQCLAALAVADPDRDLAEDLHAMRAAAAACRWGALAVATGTAQTPAGPCLPGDALGLVEGAVALVGVSLPWTARRLVDRLLAQPAEVLTVVVGAWAPDGLAAELCAHVTDRHPAVEVVVVHGGQPYPPLLLGAE